MLSIRSFLDHSLEFILYSYDEIKVPNGTSLRDASEIMPRESVFHNASNPASFSTFADVFRYRMIEETSVPWVDLDVVKLSAPLPLVSPLVGFEEPGVANTAVLFYGADSNLAGYVRDRLRAVNAAQASHVALSPKLFSQAVIDLEIQHLVQDPKVFYPVHYLDIWKLYSPKHAAEIEKLTATSSTIHLCNSVLTRVQKDFKELRPPNGSYMDSLYERHSTSPVSQEHCDYEALRKNLIPSAGERLWRFARKIGLK